MSIGLAIQGWMVQSSGKVLFLNGNDLRLWDRWSFVIHHWFINHVVLVVCHMWGNWWFLVSYPWNQLKRYDQNNCLDQRKTWNKQTASFYNVFSMVHVFLMPISAKCIYHVDSKIFDRCFCMIFFHKKYAILRGIQIKWVSRFIRIKHLVPLNVKSLVRCLINFFAKNYFRLHIR